MKNSSTIVGKTIVPSILFNAKFAAFIKVGKKYDILGKTEQEIIDKYGM